MGLNEAHGRCPDAPVFFNLFPGIWTGAHPPQEILYPTLSKVNNIFVLKEPTNNAKVGEKDFACFASFASR